MQEVDPCDDLTDDDIRTAIQNATGPKSALFVPEVSVKGLHDFLEMSLRCGEAIFFFPNMPDEFIFSSLIVKNYLSVNL